MSEYDRIWGADITELRNIPHNTSVSSDLKVLYKSVTVIVIIIINQTKLMMLN